jgi:hypothetical protein
MKLFSKPLMQWNEPTLFEARVRNRRGWMMRGVLAAGIFLVMMIGFVAQDRWGRGPKFSPVKGVVMSLVVGLFLTAALDAPGLNKQVFVYEEQISSFGNAGTVHSHASWKLRDIVRVRLYTPGEFGRSFGAMELFTRKGSAWIGVPAKTSLARIADVLAGRGIDVALTGWQPGMEEVRLKPPTFVATPTISARVEKLDEREAGQIRTPTRRNLGLTIEIVTLLVPLAGLLGPIGYAIYRVAAARGPLSRLDGEVAVGGAVLLFGGFWLAFRFGSVLPARFQRSGARTVVGMRPEALFNPEDPEAVFVSVVPRANWGKFMLSQASDVGFLKVDLTSKCLMFEGDLERWRIPAQSLMSVGVESYIPVGKTDGPQREGEPQQVRLYMTVIRARVGDDEWEAPVSKAPVDWQPRTNEQKEASAIALRDLIRELMPLGGVVQTA